MTPQLSLAPTLTDGVPGGTQSMTEADHAGAPVLSRAPLNRRVRRAGGRRTRMIAHRTRGHVVHAVGVGTFVPDVALEATIRAAALHHSVAPPISIVAADVHQKQRVAPRSTTILFVVDASWSMAVARRMRAARGAMFALLADAYLRRDRVGLVTFRDRRASVRLAPTRAISVARKALATIPIGGKTPLASALVEAARVFRREHVRQPHADALMVIVTDAAANVSVAGGAPLEEAWSAADRLRLCGVRSVVIDAERPDRDQGLASTLAQHLGASAVVLSELRADLLYREVRRALELG